MTVQDDGPYESEDDGGSSIDDICDAYVHQFDLTNRNKVNTNTPHIQMPCLFCGNLQIVSWESSVLSQCWPSAGKPLGLFVFSVETNYKVSFVGITMFLWERFCGFCLLVNYTTLEGISEIYSSPWSQKHIVETHHGLAANHLQQVQQLWSISEVREEVWHRWGRASLKERTQIHLNDIRTKEWASSGSNCDPVFISPVLSTTVGVIVLITHMYD